MKNICMTTTATIFSPSLLHFYPRM